MTGQWILREAQAYKHLEDRNIAFFSLFPILQIMKPPIETIIETIESLKHESRYHEAKETALGALARHTEDYRLYEELADIYLFEQNIEKAEEVISYARELHPESGTGIYLE